MTNPAKVSNSESLLNIGNYIARVFSIYSKHCCFVVLLFINFLPCLFFYSGSRNQRRKRRKRCKNNNNQQQQQQQLQIQQQQQLQSLASNTSSKNSKKKGSSGSQSSDASTTSEVADLTSLNSSKEDGVFAMDDLEKVCWIHLIYRR